MNLQEKERYDGEVQTYRIRLVAKEYTQFEGIDNEDTFSYVAMPKSTGIILAITAHNDYDIWQMDLKNRYFE